MPDGAMLREPPTPPPSPSKPPRNPTTPGPFAEVSHTAAEATPQERIEVLKQEAMQLAIRVQKDCPKNVESTALLGSVYELLGRTDEAVDCWQECITIDLSYAPAYLAIGQIALEKGQFEEALSICRRAQEIAPEMPKLHYTLGRALIYLGRQEEAVAAFREETRLSPEVGRFHWLLGQAYQQLKDYERARASYLKAIQLDADLWNAYYGLSIVCAQLGQTEQAKQYRERFRELKSAETLASIEDVRTRDDLATVNEGVAHVHTVAGRIYLRLGKATKAERHWLRAAELAPKDTTSRAFLITLYQKSGRSEAALEICSHLVEVFPDNTACLVNLGRVHAQLDHFDDAERAFLRVQQIAPQQSLGYRALAQLYANSPDHRSQAKTLAEKAVALEPAAANYVVLAEVCDRSGDVAGATTAMRRAVELEPNNATFRRILDEIQRGE